MPEKDSNRSASSRSKFSYLDELHLQGIEARIADGDYVYAEELTSALRKHGFRPIPASVMEYICQLLEGKMAKPKGRKQIPMILRRQQRMFMDHYYNRNLKWLAARKKRYGHLDGWPLLHGSNFWKGPPHEIAARMVARSFSYGAESWRTVHNLISSQS